MITVAIISPFRFLDSIEDVIRANDFGCSFQNYTYDQLTDIDSIYVKCQQDCDIILFSGELGYHYMLSHYPDNSLPCAFTFYGIADVLSILLSFHIRHPDVAMSRIYLDFLTPLNNYMNLQDYLPPEQLPYFFEEGNYDYEHITRRGISLWKEGKIDYVLSRSINNLQEWDRLGIPYEALYPTERMIRNSIEEAVNRERLKNLEDTNIVTFILHMPGNDEVPQVEKEYRMATLYKYLVDYRKINNLDYSIRQGFDRFVCRSSYSGSALKSLDFHRILNALQERLDFPFSVGIGIHVNEQTSQYHAERALLESNRYGHNEGFLISGEPEILTGPLSKNSIIRYSYQDINVTQFARRLGIGNAHLLRLVGLYRNDPTVLLTAADLSPLLGITLRSTRRILQKLYDLGMIMPVTENTDNNRGRPTHRFVFVPAAMDRALDIGI